MDDDPQPRRDSRCPECGAEATAESLRMHDLGALGYLHDDQRFECSECGHRYTHGVPIGEYDRDADDLWCDVCDLGWLAVHRVNPSEGGVRLHLKCPHHHGFDCPACETGIPADGLRPTRDGGVRCPHCETRVARDTAPFCFYFDSTQRDVGSSAGDHLALVGYPLLTGATDGADPYGYD